MQNSPAPINQFTTDSAQRGSAKSAESSRNLARVDHPATSERIYEAAEWEFIKAMQDFQAKSGRRHPCWSDAFEVFLDLGYTKP